MSPLTKGMFKRTKNETPAEAAQRTPLKQGTVFQAPGGISLPPVRNPEENPDASNSASHDHQDISNLALAAANAATTVKEIRGANTQIRERHANQSQSSRPTNAEDQQAHQQHNRQNESYEDKTRHDQRNSQSDAARPENKFVQIRSSQDLERRNEQSQDDKARQDQHHHKQGQESQQAPGQPRSVEQSRQGENDDQQRTGEDQDCQNRKIHPNSSEYDDSHEESQSDGGSDEGRDFSDGIASASQPILEDNNSQGFWNQLWPSSKGGTVVDEASKRLTQKKKDRLRKAKQEIENMKAAYLKLKKEKESEIKTLTNEINLKDGEVLRVVTAQSKILDEHAKLQLNFNKLRQELAEIKVTRENITHEYSAHRNRRDAKEQQLEGWLMTAQADNENLRDVIASRSRSQEPIHAEDYYKQAFNDIKSNMYDFVANLSRRSPKESLTPAVQTKVLEMIAGFGEHGICASKFLKNQLGGLCISRQYRIPLLRHIFAIFLFDRVFSLFAFPMTNEGSRSLTNIEDDLFSQGHDYNKLIMIRQAIARGVLSSCEPLVSAIREEAIEKVSSVLVILLKQRPKDIKGGVAKLIDAAIKLKKEMAGERGIYRVFLICSGDRVLQDQINTGDEGQSGETLLMCTFPGLKQYSIDDDVKTETIVIKADGEVKL